MNITFFCTKYISIQIMYNTFFNSFLLDLRGNYISKWHIILYRDCVKFFHSPAMQFAIVRLYMHVYCVGARRT